MSGEVILDIDESGIATIVLSNPKKLNAISFGMWQELRSHCAELESNPDVRVVVVRGEGSRSFAAGADISQFENSRNPETAAAYDENTECALHALSHIEVPVIAQIGGFCLGAGVSIAMCADVRVCDTTAAFAIPAARLGVAYPVESLRRLVENLGPTNSKRLLFGAVRIDATTAQQMNLVDEVVPSEELDLRVASLASLYSTNAPLSLRAAKIGIREVLRGHSGNSSLIAQVSQRCIESADYQEGVLAFAQKRAPRFQGS